MSEFLSFEQFAENHTSGHGFKYNNFYMYFLRVPESVTDSLNPDPRERRQEPFYILFHQKHPDIEKTLMDHVFTSYEMTEQGDMKWKGNPVKDLHKQVDLLYQAYVLLREYGASDQELFS